MKKLLQNIFFASCLLLIAGTVEAQAQQSVERMEYRKMMEPTQRVETPKMAADKSENAKQTQQTAERTEKKEEIILKPGKYKVPASTANPSSTKTNASAQLVQDGVGFSHSKKTDEAVRQSPIGDIENLTTEQIKQRCNEILNNAQASEDIKARATSILNKLGITQ